MHGHGRIAGSTSVALEIKNACMSLTLWCLVYLVLAGAWKKGLKATTKGIFQPRATPSHSRQHLANEETAPLAPPPPHAGSAGGAAVGLTAVGHGAPAGGGERGRDEERAGLLSGHIDSRHSHWAGDNGDQFTSVDINSSSGGGAR